MSCNEMGSHSRSRAAVITRSTARRCDARVSSRHVEFGLPSNVSNVSFLNCSARCILSQRFSQLSGNGNGNHLFTVAMHASDLLFAAGHQLFADGSMTPVFEVHCDPVLCQFAEAHA